ncbi:MAG: hypothetical protein HKL85_12870 [Acidimicrobiaceae bacterium]|nr:hypothetical protein [Acidimicrobiaceae bacterium]
MNALRRGVRSAFRNAMRSVGAVVILAVAIAQALSKIITRNEVSTQSNTVRDSTGNTITVGPTGFGSGVGSGGAPPTNAQNTDHFKIPHVASVHALMATRLSNALTNPSSPIAAGTFGGIIISSPITTALVSASGGSSPGGFVRRGGGFGGGGSSFTPPTEASGSGCLEFPGQRGVSSAFRNLHISVG